MWHDLITRFGALAVFAGSGIEGEPFALAGGLLARRGTLPLWAALLCAIGGALTVDCFWFLLGRYCRAHAWVRSAAKRPAFAKSLARIERHSILAIALFRFAYGLRAVAPVAVGVSEVSLKRYAVVSAAAAIAWGTGFTLLGYWFGALVDPWAGDIALAGCMFGLALLLGGLWRSRRTGVLPPA